MFEGFSLTHVNVPGARLRVRTGGDGPPLVLLHGHPRTHTTWHKVAPILARQFTVVCPDLRGFGGSSHAPDDAWHTGASKREKGRDIVALMAALGHEHFRLVGHDRGAYTAFRCAMDHPDTVTALAILDAVPILEALERADARFATAWWHWFFFAQPDTPERVINADPLAWYKADPTRMGPENYADFRTAITDPAVVHSMLEDYRAGLGIDRQHDLLDRDAGRRLECPTHVIWSTRDDLEQLYGDVLAVWRPWCRVLTGEGIESGHHIAEEAPQALAAALLKFFAE